MVTLDRQIRAKLRALVDRGQLNRSALARAVGWAPQTMHRYIAGGSAHASIDDVVAMARYFNQTLLEFIGPGAPVRSPSHLTKREALVLAFWRRLEAVGAREQQALLLAFLKELSVGAELRAKAPSAATHDAVKPATTRKKSRPHSNPGHAAAS